jgi:hypothetical protein
LSRNPPEAIGVITEAVTIERNLAKLRAPDDLIAEE